MIGYKGFDENLQCRGYSFREGETFTMAEPPLLCQRGFHFCDVPSNVFAYYNDPTHRYAIVEALGDIVFGHIKLATNQLKIVNVVTKDELLDLCKNQVFRVKTGEYHFNANGKFHSDQDLPAFVGADGEQKWYQNGQCHRDNDLPAIIYANGDKEWYQNGQLHRDHDLPAEIDANDCERWYQNGLIHRDHDLPAVIGANYKKWCQNGELHRDHDLPAVIYANGYQAWYRNGKLHRDNDLPAMILAGGDLFWYRNGTLLCEKKPNM